MEESRNSHKQDGKVRVTSRNLCVGVKRQLQEGAVSSLSRLMARKIRGRKGKNERKKYAYCLPHVLFSLLTI